MPECNIRFTEAAQNDLVEITEYIAVDNPSAAIKLVDEIEQNILALSDFPNMGALPKNRRLARKGYKLFIISDYMAFYVIFGNIIEIRRIVSCKRNYIKLI
jgi:addiction module RelE/StbE family toxin